jgi:hypothetical protein
LLEEYCKSGRRRRIAGGVGGGDFDEVFAELRVNDALATGTKEDVMEDTVHINIVADIGLRVEVVGGLRPTDVGLGAAVAGATRIQVSRCGRWRRVIRIGGWSDEGDGIAEWAGVIAEIDGTGSEAVSGAGLEETERGVGDAAADAEVKSAVQIDLRREVRSVVLRRYPRDLGIVGADLVNGNDGGAGGRGGVARETNATEVRLGGGLARRVFGVDAEGIGVPGIKGGKGVAGGGLRKDDRGTDIVSAPEVIVEVAGVRGSWVPSEGDGVSGSVGDAKVLGRRWPPCRGRGRAEDHYKHQGPCSDIGRERRTQQSGSFVFTGFFNPEHNVISFLRFECELIC